MGFIVYVHAWQMRRVVRRYMEKAVVELDLLQFRGRTDAAYTLRRKIVRVRRYLDALPDASLAEAHERFSDLSDCLGWLQHQHACARLDAFADSPMTHRGMEPVDSSPWMSDSFSASAPSLS